ncbi:MAG TPA: TetR/AcrR family transcriptional regulator [Cellvibrionaceae bacterium]
MKTSREALLLIALRMFLKKGYELTSMRDLVDASGLSKGAFHHYFPRKADLLSACIEHFFTRFLPETEPQEYQHFDALVLACARHYGALMDELARLDIPLAAYQRFIWSTIPEYGASFAERQSMLELQLVQLAEQDLANQCLTSHASAQALATQAMALIEGLGVLQAVNPKTEPSGAAQQLIVACQQWLADLTRHNVKPE